VSYRALIGPTGSPRVFNRTTQEWGDRDLGGGGGAAVGARIELSSSFSLGSSTLERIPFDVVVDDDGGFFNAGTPGVLTVPAGMGGWYAVSGGARLAGLSTIWGMGIRDGLGGFIVHREINTGVWTHGLSGIVKVEEGEDLECVIRKGSATSQSVAADARSFFAVAKLS
jgi:hypothetical protein